MGRLIDTSNIRVKPQYMQDVMGIAMIRCEDLARILADVPTADAIPKTEVKKFLEEGIKDVNNNVLAIVREDYIHKADYENRLKADMVAALEELRLSIEGLDYPKDCDYACNGCLYWGDVDNVIQQKINELKGESEG